MPQVCGARGGESASGWRGRLLTRRNAVQPVASTDECKNIVQFMPPVAPKEYFDKHYAADCKLFGSEIVGRSALARSLKPRARERFRGLAEFFVCRFELCLLNQAIYTHFRPAHKVWLGYSAPNASPLSAHRTDLGSGRPDEILRFAQKPVQGDRVEAVKLNWDLLHDFTGFFFEDYMARFLAEHQDVNLMRSEFISAISADTDCVASVRNGHRWDTKALKAFLPKRMSRERKWVTATPGEREEIEASVRRAQMMFEIKGSPIKVLLEHAPVRSDVEAKKLAFRLARHKGRLDLSVPVWQKAISIAARDNDHDFFRKLGRRLTSAEPEKDDDSGLKDKTRNFLLKHWARRVGGLPELFYLRYPDMLKLCQRHAGEAGNEDSLEKICERELGLKPLEGRQMVERRLCLDQESEKAGLLVFRRPDGWLYP